jgi:hypothetical protein
MDKVEFGAVNPFVFGIVDFEVAIWRDAAILACVQDVLL